LVNVLHCTDSVVLYPLPILLASLALMCTKWCANEKIVCLKSFVSEQSDAHSKSGCLHTGILIVRQLHDNGNYIYTCTSFWFLILFKLWSLRRERSKYIRLSKRDRIYFYAIYVNCTPLQDPLLIHRYVNKYVLEC